MTWQRIQDAPIVAVAGGLAQDSDTGEIALLVQADRVQVVLEKETALAFIEGLNALVPIIESGKAPVWLKDLPMGHDVLKDIDKAARKNRKRLGLEREP